MKTVPALVLGIALLGCEQQEPDIPDADFALFRREHPGMTQGCLDAFRYGGIDKFRPDDPDCYEMLPSQRWSGLWESGREWSNFCAEPAEKCDWTTKRGTWLVFTDGIRPSLSSNDSTYKIEFVGRRTKVPGNFGHSNAYDHLMVVDRLISMEPDERMD